MFLLLLTCVLLSYAPIRKFVNAGDVARVMAVAPENTGSVRGERANAASRRGGPEGSAGHGTAADNSNDANIEVNIQAGRDVPKNAVGDEKSRSLQFLIYCAFILAVFGSLFTMYMFAPSTFNRELYITFLHNNGLRYIALAAIIVAIVLFGLTEVIEGKDVTVLLSAIAGYVLGADSSVSRRRDDDRSRPPENGAPSSEPSSCCPPTPAPAA